MGTYQLLLTCEHAGNRIPGEYRRLFQDAEETLQSHRGWDPGALALAEALGRRLSVPLRATAWSRLLVDANRSERNPRLWSAWTRPLSQETRRRILERYWRPHRQQVETAVRRAVARGRQVLHVAVHSFTPVLNGTPREADVGLLYDTARATERELCARWHAALRAGRPEVRVRRNYPYRGRDDGLPTWLRRRFPDASYAGFELELNQAFLRAEGVRRVAPWIAHALAEVRGQEKAPPPGRTGRGREGVVTQT